nr:DUF2809 domain-containing protein [Pyxidicoccus fallax]
MRPEARSARELPGLEDRLASLYATGQRTWPGVPLAEEDFLRNLAERLPPGEDVARWLAAVHGADLDLACACAKGEPAAHAALERHGLPKVVAAVARVRGTRGTGRASSRTCRGRKDASVFLPALDGGHGGRPLAPTVGRRVDRGGMNVPSAGVPSPLRVRVMALVLALLVLALGLASRSKSVAWPPFFAAYAGDTLWALLVFLLVRFLAPARPVLHVAAAALAFSFAVEFSQLYQAPWLNAVRGTLPGRLVLGAGFLWSDLVCYSAGVLAGLGLSIALRLRAAKP